MRYALCFRYLLLTDHCLPYEICDYNSAAHFMGVLPSLLLTSYSFFPPGVSSEAGVRNKIEKNRDLSHTPVK